MPKPKTLYSNNQNVDINNFLSKELKESKSVSKNNAQLGGARKKSKKEESDESEYGSDTDADEISSEDDDDDEEEDDNEQVDDDGEVNPDEDDEEEGDEEGEGDEEEDDDAKSRKSNESDEEFKDEEKKCYSKYALPDNDEIDYDELFADDDFKMKKTERLSKPILFKYEKVRLLSVRAKQLAQGAKPMIKNTVGLSPKDIALLELKNKVIPLIIERPVPNSGVERWKLSELEIPEEMYN